MKNYWENLSKPVKVFFYLLVSTILAEALVELGNLDRTFLVRISAQIINLLLVLLETGAKEVRMKIRK